MELLTSFDLVNGFTPTELANLAASTWSFGWLMAALVLSRLLGVLAP